MKIIIISILFIGLFNSNTEQLTQNNPQTEVSFKVKNLGFSVEGEFTDVVFESNFNRDDLDDSFINATIKIKSLDTGNRKRDKDLMKAKYFDVDKFAEIKYNSTEIEKLQDNNYKLTGNLTIKKTTKLVTILIEIDDSNENLVIKSDFVLNRGDYNVGKKSWVMSNKVKIKVLYTINIK
jgi:polyisoprenoid-binding protein YceI